MLNYIILGTINIFYIINIHININSVFIIMSSEPGFDLEGKSQLMIDFIEVREQISDYRTNLLAMLE